MHRSQDSAVDRPSTRRTRVHAPFAVQARPAAASLLLLALVVGLAVRTGRAAPDTGETLAVRVLDAEPRLDGNLQEWGFEEPGSPVAVIDRREQALPARAAVWKGPDDLSARFQAGLSADALYFAFAIRDDAAFHPGEPWWHGDAIELFLDLGYEAGAERATAYHEGCWQLFIMPRNPDLDWGVAFQGTRLVFDDGGLRGIRVASREREDGYDVEVRIPLADLGLSGAAPRDLGFALALNDADAGPADPGSYFSWNGGFDLYRSPDHFGTLRLPAAPPRPRRPPCTAAWVCCSSRSPSGSSCSPSSSS